MVICYYHKDILNIPIHVPTGSNQPYFCSDEEHEKWADKVYGKKEELKPREVSEMQQRLLEMGKSAISEVEADIFTRQIK